jgi:hypothetical protein
MLPSNSGAFSLLRLSESILNNAPDAVIAVDLPPLMRRSVPEKPHAAFRDRAAKETGPPTAGQSGHHA